MAALSPLLSILIFVTGCPTALVAMPSFGSTAIGKALEVRQDEDKGVRMHGDIHEEVIADDISKKIVRKESFHAPSSITSPEQMNLKLEEHLKPGEAPCEPGALAEAMRLLKVKATNPHGAATIPDSGAADPDDPCTKLAKKLTPSVAFGHVIIKEPDGNVSQVPDKQEEEETYMEQLENTGILWKVTTSLFWLFILVVLCGIVVQNKGQKNKAKQVKKQREEEAIMALGATDKMEDIQTLIKEGASAGKIAMATKRNEELKKQAEAEKAAASASPSTGAPGAP